MEIESLSTNFFNSAQATLLNKNSPKLEKKEGAKKSSFKNSMEKAAAEQQMISIGLPPQIAGMSNEDAAIFLKDAADIAGDKLQQNPSPENFAEYRKAVGQFLKFVEKNSFDYIHKLTGKISYKGTQITRSRIVMINENLESMARMFFASPVTKINIELLQKMGTIQGLIIDLLAE